MPIPKSSDAARRRENLDVFGVHARARRGRRDLGAVAWTPLGRRPRHATRSSERHPSCPSATPRRNAAFPRPRQHASHEAHPRRQRRGPRGLRPPPRSRDRCDRPARRARCRRDDRQRDARCSTTTTRAATPRATTRRSGSTRRDSDRSHRDRDRQGGRPARVRPGAARAPVARRPTPAPRADGVDGRYNNVDIAYDVGAGGATVDVAVVSDRYNDQLRFFTIDPAGAGRDDAAHRGDRAPSSSSCSARTATTVDEEHTAYGLAVWQPGAGTTYAVVTQEGEHDHRHGADRRRSTARSATPTSTQLDDARRVPAARRHHVGAVRGARASARSSRASRSTSAPARCTPRRRTSACGAIAAAARLERARAHRPGHRLRHPRRLRPGDRGVRRRSTRTRPATAAPDLVADAEGVDIYYGPGGTGLRHGVQPGRRHATPCTQRHGPQPARSARSGSRASTAWTTSTAPTASR